MNKELLDGETLFVIHDFLDPDECQRLIEFSEEIGYDEATITTASGGVMIKEVRNNDRVIHDDVDLAKRLWDKAKEWILPNWLGRQAVGFNERFRFYRYDPGQKFAAHSDGHYLRENGEKSQLTFMIYLNGGFEGGATRFLKPKKKWLTVTPSEGKALVFAHQLVHEGQEVTEGRKYVLRTDIMFRKCANDAE